MSISLQFMIGVVANTLPVVLSNPTGYRQALNNSKDGMLSPPLFLKAPFGNVSSWHWFKQRVDVF